MSPLVALEDHGASRNVTPAAAAKFFLDPPAEVSIGDVAGTPAPGATKPRRRACSERRPSRWRASQRTRDGCADGHAQLEGVPAPVAHKPHSRALKHGRHGHDWFLPGAAGTVFA